MQQPDITRTDILSERLCNEQELVQSCLTASSEEKKKKHLGLELRLCEQTNLCRAVGVTGLQLEIAETFAQSGRIVVSLLAMALFKMQKHTTAKRQKQL